MPPIDAITTEAEAQDSDIVVESSLSNDSGRAEKVSKGKDVAFVFVNACVSLGIFPSPPPSAVFVN